MSARPSGGDARGAAPETGARIVLKLRFPPPDGPAPPELAELIDRIDRLETRQSRRKETSETQE